MKKIYIILLSSVIILLSAVTASANGAMIYTKNGEVRRAPLYINTYLYGEDKIKLSNEIQYDAPAEELYKVCDNYDFLLTYDFKTDDKENPYPEIEKMQVRITMPQPSGGSGAKLGRNFRVYYIGAETEPEMIDFDIITDGISFTTNKLGRYALYFDEEVYDVIFYADENESEQYTILKDLKEKDTVVFPKIPEKTGFVFTGWKVRAGSGLSFTLPQPHTALNYAKYYASWCAEEEYKPLEIYIASDKTITKGEEDGQNITVKLSDGFFGVNRDDLSSIENWKLIGTDDVTVEKIEPVDNKTVNLTLSGNSKDVYSTAEINVEFKSDLIIFETTDNDGQPVIEPQKIQLDADGVKAVWYKSTNTIDFNKQSKSDNGGGRVVSTFTVKFDTDGGSSIATKTVKRNETIGAIETPVKDGFVFDGWYSDKSLTKVFDINTKIVSSTTLYAKWVEKPMDNAKNELVLTVGKKDASVFGEIKANDVAPVIQNGRIMLPARFVAENLGATVLWNEQEQLVTISGKNEKNENVVILITIGAEYAEVNGEKIKLDIPAFIENDRTYTQMQFISEQLGANVEWDEAKKKITLTRKTADNK